MATRQKKKDDGIPDFLRRKRESAVATATSAVVLNRRRFATAEDSRLPPPKELPPLPPGLRYSETISEESGFAQKPGVVIRRWADAAHVQRKLDELRQHEADQKERAERDAENRRRAAERLAKLPRGPRIPEGYVTLTDALKMTGLDIKRGHAKAAIDASNIIHSNYAVPRSDASIARLRVVLSAYQPPAPRRSEHDHAPEALIVFTGKGNPKKEGTGAHERWKLLIAHHNKTVAAFVEAGGNQTTLANAIKQGRAELREKNSVETERANKGQVSRKDGKRVRGQAKKAGAVGSREPARRANAGKSRASKRS